MEDRFIAQVDITKKDYIDCNNFYLKKYIGIKEIVMVALLFASGIAVFFLIHNYLLLIMSGVVVVLLSVALLLYYRTTVKGYKMEFVDRGATQWTIKFNDLGMVIETYEKGGEVKYTEKCLYADLEKAAVLKDKVYFFVGSALSYYVLADDMTGGNFIDFCDFVREKVPAQKFKMKSKRKQFPYSR